LNLLHRSIYYGWWIVVSSFFIHATAFGFYWLGFSVFFLPLANTLGIGRAAASLPFTIRGIIGIVQAPLVGVLVDRLGPAKILIVCALLGGLGYVLLSFVNSYLMFMIVFLVLISIGMMPFDLPTTAAVGRWFNRKRGKAMSLAFMGFPFGGMVLIPLMALAVDHFGWRPD
jgi:MFS family permease